MKRTLRAVFLSLLFAFAFSFSSFSQVNGDYGSVVVTGNWGTLSTWKTYNAGSFSVAAVSLPTSADNVWITSGTTVYLDANSYNCKNLTVQATAKLYSNANVGNKYLFVNGNIVCDGTIGNGAIPDDISFDPVAASVTISGTGTFDASVIRKNTSTNTTTDLFINRDVNLRGTGTQIYNNIDQKIFNVTVGLGATLTLVNGSASIDETIGGGPSEAGGTWTINGTMDVQGTLYVTTNNTIATYTCKWMVNGELKANAINAGSSMNAKDTMSVNNGGKLNITGTSAFTALGTSNTIFLFNNGSTVEYSALGAQTVKVSTDFAVPSPANLSQYYDLIISGSGAKTLNNNMGVRNDITITNATGAAVLAAGIRSINIGGDWTNYNQSGFTESNVASNRVTFNGTAVADQYITCPGGEAFWTMTASKTGAGNIYLNNDLTINGATGTGGLYFNITDIAPLVLNGHKLSINNTSATAIQLTPGTTNRFIISETAVGSAAYATNPSIIEWKLDTAKGTYVFPFGVNGTYIPLTIAKKSSAAFPTVSVSTRATTNPDNTPWDTTTNVPYVSQMISNFLVDTTQGGDSSTIDRWWDITSTTANLLVDSVQFTYRGSENTLLTPYNTTTPIVPHNWTGASWANRNSRCLFCNTGVTAGTGTISIQNDTLNAAPWVLVGWAIRLLPVTLLEFTAKLNDDKVFVNWATGSEINNDYFTVEKSTDGKTFVDVGKVPGAGNTTETHYYRLIDPAPYDGLSYYRLKQTDYNGKATYSDMVPVLNKDKNSTWYVFPNPATDYINIGSTADDLLSTRFQLYNLEGTLIKTLVFDMKNRSLFSVDLKDLSNGIYIAKVSDEFHQEVFKIVRN